ncbi:MAG: UDP-2,3-diacylglucosamine diphosphatase LpxI [Planctomycetaceae bacterium]|nr:UDP-2,3-diacylglucosamine diphosphatase LpxI [Planctomycetaceae bacterium]MCB9952275.1 UDP-2,3-diacylglucosamine diphosphatase LpxI [Planctomycetaceae bacterium]
MASYDEDNKPATIPFRQQNSHREPIGLLAGWGRFPIVFAEAAKKQGFEVHCIGIDGLVDPAIAEHCTTFEASPLARVGRAIRFFKRRKVTSAVMAGKVEKRVLFDPFRIFRLLPDWRTLHMWFRYCTENKKDDTLLLAVIREFARDGIHFKSALEFCPELLVQHGFLTRRQPTSAQWKDIRFGWEIAKEMGRLDIGQTVIVNDTAVIAIEAIEGTDECIRRAGQLCRRGGMTLVKVAKPQQDMRFDVPTVGLQTIQTMCEAGARVLAIEAGMTILLDEPKVIELADKLGICIVSLKAEEVQLKAVA